MYGKRINIERNIPIVDQRERERTILKRVLIRTRLSFPKVRLPKSLLRFFCCFCGPFLDLKIPIFANQWPLTKQENKTPTSEFSNSIKYNYRGYIGEMRKHCFFFCFHFNFYFNFFFQFLCFSRSGKRKSFVYSLSLLSCHVCLSLFFENVSKKQ